VLVSDVRRCHLEVTMSHIASHPRHPRALVVRGLVAASLIVAGACGNDSKPAQNESGAKAARVELGATDLGEVLVDAEGRTLYAFTPDTSTSSTCTGGCAQTWPPATTRGNPSAGSGVSAGLAVITRADGRKQVVANGHPLYRFSGDTKSGDVTGQGSGGSWYAVSAEGSLMRVEPTTTPTPTASPTTTKSRAAGGY